MVRNKGEGRQAEVVWTCHEERPGVCRKKGDRNEGIRKEEKREAKDDMKEIGVKETDIRNRALWKSIICCGNS